MVVGMAKVIGKIVSFYSGYEKKIPTKSGDLLFISLMPFGRKGALLTDMPSVRQS